MKRFLRWLNRTALFDWRKPENFDELETRVKETPQERKEKHNHTQVDTYGINELKLLNEYATPLERLLLLLGLNCAFGAAEQGRLTLGDIHFNKQHPHAALLNFESTPDDSFSMALSNIGKLWLVHCRSCLRLELQRVRVPRADKPHGGWQFNTFRVNQRFENAANDPYQFIVL